MALDWCRTQRLEPPASDHLERVIRSAVHGYETQQLATIHVRLSTHNKTAIDRLLASEETDPDDAQTEESTNISFSNLTLHRLIDSQSLRIRRRSKGRSGGVGRMWN